MNLGHHSQRLGPGLLAICLLLTASLSAVAQTPPSSPSETPGARTEKDTPFRFFPKAATIFPIFLGGGAGASLFEHFQADFMLGFTPQAYYSLIGRLAANSSGNAAYRDVIEAAFQNNSVLRLALQYNFHTAAKGWRVAVAGSTLSSSGQSSINTVLTAATGRNFTSLTNLLTALGRSTQVNLNTSLSILEAQGGYAFEIAPRLSLSVMLGVAKVMSSEMTIQTGLPVFENSASGSSLLRQTESDLEAIVNQYGISPTLGVSISYLF